MANYRIITDSTTDLSAAMVRELDVLVIPLSYIMDGNTFHDIPGGGELTAHEFYEKLRSGKMSTTAQINTDQFLQTFTPILEGGEDLLYIAFSSGLSGTCNSARIASAELREKYPGRRIEVVDTLAASMGEGLLVWYAAKMRESGKSMDEVVQWLKENALRLCHWFTVDDLNHLKRGGRVSAATALVGTVLGIKPILHVDDEGHLINVGKTRGRKRSLEALVEEMEKRVEKPEEQVVFISHGDCPEDAAYVEKLVRDRWKVKEVCINTIGPVIGAHSGPGTVALFFLGSPR